MLPCYTHFSGLNDKKVAEGLRILARALYHGELVDSEHHIVCS